MTEEFKCQCGRDIIIDAEAFHKKYKQLRSKNERLGKENNRHIATIETLKNDLSKLVESSPERR